MIQEVLTAIVGVAVVTTFILPNTHRDSQLSRLVRRIHDVRYYGLKALWDSGHIVWDGPETPAI